MKPKSYRKLLMDAEKMAQRHCDLMAKINLQMEKEKQDLFFTPEYPNLTLEELEKAVMAYHEVLLIKMAEQNRFVLPAGNEFDYTDKH